MNNIKKETSLTDEEVLLLEDREILESLLDELPAEEYGYQSGLSFIMQWQVDCYKCHAEAFKLIKEWQPKWSLYMKKVGYATKQVALYGLTYNMPGKIKSAKSSLASQDAWDFADYN